jgi:hypothetical protein
LWPLLARIDPIGLIEHAVGPTPDPTSGHCADDAGRALAMAARMPWDPDGARVALACLSQLERSVDAAGRLTLRLDRDGRATEDAPSDDAHGRALWGLAHASMAAFPGDFRRRADRLFCGLSELCTPHPRAAAHAVVAATTLLRARPRSLEARRLLAANAGAVPVPRPGAEWPWPEARLGYGNGLLVEALLALADLDADVVSSERAVRLLRWLVAHERGPSGTFSFTQVGGRGPADPAGFDQQPIEPWTLAEACVRACECTGSEEWVEVTGELSSWFDGENDLGVAMWDPATGAAYDGLTVSGVNTNQGTESTLALLGTRLAAWRLRQRAVAPRRSSR